MRIHCTQCGQKAIIGKTNWITGQTADIYCSCCDPECGHTFVMSLGFSHTLSPSAKNTSDLVTALFKSMPREDVMKINRQLSFL
ncbi:ogr/Delta-like zinc finger family protein [Photobacterium japonica]|uniref:ogr/Delta-like zinc finger family protein n=1 Tax=Photobacterium japonica TaxID=2910235 RepID=UPI003D1523B2